MSWLNWKKAVVYCQRWLPTTLEGRTVESAEDNGPPTVAMAGDPQFCSERFLALLKRDRYRLAFDEQLCDLFTAMTYSMGVPLVMGPTAEFYRITSSDPLNMSLIAHIVCGRRRNIADHYIASANVRLGRDGERVPLTSCKFVPLERLVSEVGEDSLCEYFGRQPWPTPLQFAVMKPKRSSPRNPATRHRALQHA